MITVSSYTIRSLYIHWRYARVASCLQPIVCMCVLLCMCVCLPLPHAHMHTSYIIRHLSYTISSHNNNTTYNTNGI